MGMCATKKPVRRYANGGMLDSPLEAVMPFEPRQPATNPLQNQVNALDQKIAMGNAMDGLSNTERYQLANPTNAAYKPGSMMGGTSADASMQRQQNSILQSLRSGIAAQMPDTQQSKWVGGGTESSIPSIGDAFQIGQPRRFADGGIVGLLKNRKKAIDDAVNGAESPNAIVQANPPSAGVKPSMGSQADNYAAEAAKLEAEQLAAAISDQTMIITSNVTEDYPVLDLPDARPLLNREVALTYPDRGYHRRIAAIAVPVRRSHFETSHEWGGAFIGNAFVAFHGQLMSVFVSPNNFFVLGFNHRAQLVFKPLGQIFAVFGEVI